MKMQNRRDFLTISAGWAATALAVHPVRSNAQEKALSCAMKLALSPGAIGVKANLRQSIQLASRHGFQAVEPNAAYLVELGKAGISELLQEMKSQGILFSTAGLPVDFRGDDAKFKTGMEALPRLAEALQSAGATRMSTWIMPSHAELTYLQNFRRHVSRLRDVARVLGDHGLRLGLEYVGTPTLRNGVRFPFLHTMREARELIEEIGAGNIGFLLDSWHWWTAGESEVEIASLKPSEVISVDLNDAPAGIPLEQQQDGKRELPCATGVIPVAAFLHALKGIGYDGPVRVEPFNKAVSSMAEDAACAAAITSLRQAMALIGCPSSGAQPKQAA